ncbi:MAG TPA: DinB family protein [Chitinophagaceae bacterium]|nr:DinB family protein [Chitinophagaceae bacterium]
MPKPIAADYPEYFGRYISQVSEEDLYEAFKIQFPKIESFLHSIDEEKANFAYAPGKWTLKELLQHLIDAERIFDYRALCFARKEAINLPSFDENLYAENSGANERNWKSLSNEFINARITTQDLFKSFSDEMLQLKGTANNNSISVHSIGYTLIGHVYHHLKVVQEKYL